MRHGQQARMRACFGAAHVRLRRTVHAPSGTEREPDTVRCSFLCGALDFVMQGRAAGIGGEPGLAENRPGFRSEDAVLPDKLRERACFKQQSQ